MMRKLYGCTRKPQESTAMHARRFQILALEYLNLCDANTTEQDSQNFAMLLLDNARIPALVYSTVDTQLISNATARPDQIDERIYIIGKDNIKMTRTKATSRSKCSCRSTLSSSQRRQNRYSYRILNGNRSHQATHCHIHKS